MLGVSVYTSFILKCLGTSIPKKNTCYFLFTFCLLVLTATTNAQGPSEKLEYYQWVDQLSGIENTALYNGIGYVEKYRVINKYHKFFKTTDFLPGTLTYEGYPYPGLELKYDLDDDQILVNLKNGDRIVLLQPIKNRISSFEIDGHRFVHIRDSVLQGQNLPGFLEVLWEGSSMRLFEKHFKQRFRRTGKKSVHFEFKSRNIFILKYNGEYHPVRNRNDLIRIFPEFKKKIQAYSKKRFPKSNPQNHLISLGRRVQALLMNPNPEQQ